MFATKLILGPLVGVTLLVSSAGHGGAEKSANDVAFERLKKLVGDWQDANAKSDAEKSIVVLRYRLTAADSVLVEIDFPGTAKEMMTMYHRDGDQLVLTHYCGCGNQPRMRARAGAVVNELVFDFDGGTNLNPAKGFHMHDAVIRFGDDDHIHSEWEYFVDGKAGGKHSFDLVRKK
jgi:hypothetical protein